MAVNKKAVQPSAGAKKSVGAGKKAPSKTGKSSGGKKSKRSAAASAHTHSSANVKARKKRTVGKSAGENASRELRNFGVLLKLSVSEAASVTTAANKAGMNRADYIRTKIGL